MQLKRLALTAALALCAAGFAASRELPQGPWHGKLSLGIKRLNLVLRFGADGQCTLDSPDQGATGIPAEVLVRTPDSVAVAVPRLDVLYTAKVTDSTIAGRFRQGPYTFSLTLRPGEVDVRRPQTPRPPLPYRTEEVTVDAGDATLSGTLTYPAGGPAAGVPLVVMVSGSGLQNRDEEIMQHRPFAVIADYLARHGIASLRYDDRGYARSTGSNEHATTDTYAADAAAAVAHARALGSFGRVGVLGHSEGGTIAFILASRGEVDFAVSMAGAAERGMDILMRQNRQALREAGVADTVAAQYCSALAAVLSGREAHTAGLPDKLVANLELIHDSRSPWLRHFAAYDPSEAISTARCPVFAFGGTLDKQVDTDANLAVVRAHLPAGPHNSVRAYEGLNHLLQPCRTGSVAEYGTVETTIAPEVLADIAAWIASAAI